MVAMMMMVMVVIMMVYGGDDVCGGNYDNDHQDYENGEPPC